MTLTLLLIVSEEKLHGDNIFPSKRLSHHEGQAIIRADPVHKGSVVAPADGLDGGAQALDVPYLVEFSEGGGGLVIQLPL